MPVMKRASTRSRNTDIVKQDGTELTSIRCGLPCSDHANDCSHACVQAGSSSKRVHCRPLASRYTINALLAQLTPWSAHASTA